MSRHPPSPATPSRWLAALSIAFLPGMLAASLGAADGTIFYTNGSHPQRLVQSPAAFPTWAIGGAVTPPARPLLRAMRNGNVIEMRLDNLTAGRQIQIEGTTDLRNWTRLNNLFASVTSQTVTITPTDESSVGFYRVVVP